MALTPYDINVYLATMGRPLTAEQRKEAAAVANVDICESSYKLEWMSEPWGDVAASGQWLLELERRLHPDIIQLNGYAHGVLPWRVPSLIVGHSCVLSWWRAVHGCDAPQQWNRYKAVD